MYPHPLKHYLRPHTVAEAVAALDEYGPNAKVIAGGQSLMTELKARAIAPRALIDINRVAELAALSIEENSLRCGALVRFATIANNTVINARWSALAEAAGAIGDRQVRNRGTVLGSLVYAAHWGDIAPAAAVLGAEVEIAGSRATRRLTVEEFVLGPRQTALKADELAIALHVPKPNGGSAYVKHGRVTQDRATLSVAVALDHSSGRRAVRIAVGGLSLHPICRALEAEASLQDAVLDDAALRRAGECAANSLSPQTDELASADYRRQLLRVLVPRALGLAAARGERRNA